MAIFFDPLEIWQRNNEKLYLGISEDSKAEFKLSRLEKYDQTRIEDL